MSTRTYSRFDKPARARLSAKDYIASPQSEPKSDLIEGVFVKASSADRLHEVSLTLLAGVCGHFISHSKRGKLTGPDAAYRLNGENGDQSDRAFVSTERQHLGSEVSFSGAPNLAAGVILPSSRQPGDLKIAGVQGLI